MQICLVRFDFLYSDSSRLLVQAAVNNEPPDSDSMVSVFVGPRAYKTLTTFDIAIPSGILLAFPHIVVFYPAMLFIRLFAESIDRVRAKCPFPPINRRIDSKS